MNAVSGSTQNCPSCGAQAPPLLKHSKLAVCGYCNSTLFIEDAQVASAGEKSVLSEIPSILSLGQPFQLGHWNGHPVGRIRYEYGGGDGYWDEWWVQLSGGNTQWISNDEGEYVIENEIKLDGEAPLFEEFQIGGQIQLFDQSLHVTEVNEATCIGLEGQLPEIVAHGDTHRYAHLEGPKGLLITAEYDDESSAFYKGVWIDPFEIEIG
ncbi:MAG: ribosomal protein S27AE [Gammaproteobacteria bacterium]|jgi:ribosomal protein S27AE